MDIYKHALKGIENGVPYHIDLTNKVFSIGNTTYIDKHVTDGYEIVLNVDDAEDAVTHLAVLYEKYKHSVPGEHEIDCPFKAMDFNDLEEEDMFGEPRRVAQFNLMYYLIAYIVSGVLTWEKIANPKWFFYKVRNTDLVLLNKFFINQTTTL